MVPITKDTAHREHGEYKQHPADCAAAAAAAAAVAAAGSVVRVARIWVRGRRVEARGRERAEHTLEGVRRIAIAMAARPHHIIHDWHAAAEGDLVEVGVGRRPNAHVGAAGGLTARKDEVIERGVIPGLVGLLVVADLSTRGVGCTDEGRVNKRGGGCRERGRGSLSASTSPEVDQPPPAACIRCPPAR